MLPIHPVLPKMKLALWLIKSSRLTILYGIDSGLWWKGSLVPKSAMDNRENKAIRDGRPRPPRHQVGWDIVRRECACQISWWSVEKWRRYYILKFHGNTFRWPTTLTFDLKFWKYLSVTEYPYSMCMLSFMMIGWEMTEILHFEILRKHGQTHKQTWALQYLALPLWGAR